MSSYVFNQFKYDMVDANYFANTDNTYYVALVNAVPFDTSSVSIANNHKYWKNVSAAWSISADSDFNSIGYNDKGLSAAAGKFAFLNNNTDTVNISALDITWSNSTIDARGAIIYNKSASQLMVAIDFGEVKSTVHGDFKIIWNNSKFFTIN